MEESQLIRASENCVSSAVDGETILLHLTEGVYFGLDRTGALIWEQIESGATLSDVVSALHARFDVAEERLRNDVVALVSQLEEKGLVVIGETPA